MDLSPALTDPELGFTGFTVLRTSYRRQGGESVPSNQTLPASGCIHPGSPEMLQLLPEEENKEEFIAIYTDYALSTGTPEGSGAVSFTAPDRIHWNSQTWRVVRVRDWQMFGYYQAYAVLGKAVSRRQTRMSTSSPWECALEYVRRADWDS